MNFWFLLEILFNISDDHPPDSHSDEYYGRYEKAQVFLRIW